MCGGLLFAFSMSAIILNGWAMDYNSDNHGLDPRPDHITCVRMNNQIISSPISPYQEGQLSVTAISMRLSCIQPHLHKSHLSRYMRFKKFFNNTLCRCSGWRFLTKLRFYTFLLITSTDECFLTKSCVPFQQSYTTAARSSPIQR